MSVPFFFIFPDILTRDYERLRDLCPHLEMPKRYLFGYLWKFIIWYFIAALFYYKIFVIVGLFLMIYISNNLFLFTRIWRLLGLSVPRLIITVGLFFIIDVVTSGILRTAFINSFLN